jgi:hypothetical protein
MPKQHYSKVDISMVYLYIHKWVFQSAIIYNLHIQGNRKQHILLWCKILKIEILFTQMFCKDGHVIHTCMKRMCSVTRLIGCTWKNWAKTYQKIVQQQFNFYYNPHPWVVQPESPKAPTWKNCLVNQFFHLACILNHRHAFRIWDYITWYIAIRSNKNTCWYLNCILFLRLWIYSNRISTLKNLSSFAAKIQHVKTS